MQMTHNCFYISFEILWSSWFFDLKCWKAQWEVKFHYQEKSIFLKIKSTLCATLHLALLIFRFVFGGWGVTAQVIPRGRKNNKKTTKNRVVWPLEVASHFTSPSAILSLTVILKFNKCSLFVLADFKQIHL